MLDDDSDDPIDADVLEQLRLQGDQRRKHATFFSWHDRSPHGKGVAETGAVQTLVDAMASAGLHDFVNPRPSGDSWPDCIAEDPHGAPVAFEVTELVDRKALPDGPPKPWSLGAVRDRLEAIITTKDQKSFGGGRYCKVVLLIHTDELYIDAQVVGPALKHELFTTTHGNLNRVFLLFSYDPKVQTYPFVELRLAA